MTRGCGTGWRGRRPADTGPDPRAASAMVAARPSFSLAAVNSIDPGFPAANRIIYGDRGAGRSCMDQGPRHRTAAAMGSWHGVSEGWRRCRSDRASLVDHPSSDPPRMCSLQAGVMHDTWEHADQGVGPGQGQGPVTIQSLAIIPPEVQTPGTANGMITLSGPALAGGRYCAAYEGSIADISGLPRFWSCIASHDTCQQQIRQLQHRHYVPATVRSPGFPLLVTATFRNIEPKCETCFSHRRHNL